MATETISEASQTLRENLRGVRDALTVSRVFGESYEVDGATIIPVARVGGGAGGGAGDDDAGAGGFGGGFGIGAAPVGVYVVTESGVEWQPTIDVNRLVKGGQVLAGIIAVCTALVLGRRR